jgi:hypothetical protein
MPQQPRILVDREAQGGIMAGTKQEKSKSIDFEAAQEDREESRHEAEEVEQQDLNQGGTDTGTHDSTKHGVNWGRAYKTHAKEIKPKAASGKKPIVDTTSDS